MKVSAENVANVVKEGDNVQLIYPSSKGGAAQGRVGRVEKVLPTMMVVETPQGYRSFKYERIIGEVQIGGE